MKKLLIIIVLLIFCLFLYGKYIEVNNFKIHEYTIYNENIPESFKELKIVHLSDILYKANFNKNKLTDIVTKINEQNPDIVIFSGDLLDSREKYKEEDIKIIKEQLKNIKSTLFKFAVIGDNDESHLDIYKDILYDSDFVLLDNENKLVFYKDINPINIIGLTDLNNIDTLLNTDVECNYNLVVTHKPDNLSTLSNYDINTILSGHSLGGIINIPFYGGLVTKDGAKTYLNNNYTLNNTQLFVSNGIGYEKFEFRLFNTPSINIYRFDN